jgi:tetratricopeptide (TPR) repeat protein
MYCPECGNDAAEAKFCPECGHQIPKSQSKSQSTSRPRSQRRAAARQVQTAAAPSKPRTPVALIWAGFAAAAAIVVVILLVSTGGSAGGAADSGGAAGAASQSVASDTSGSYAELVDRANGLYDQGIAAFNKDDAEGGVAYFEAAAKVYGAAWAKQPGDPNVGTDYAVALFYQRHHDAGIKQIEAVLELNPDFQAAHLNRGIFMRTEAAEVKDKAKAADHLAEAKLAFQKAVSIDPDSEAGKHAAQELQDL